MSRGRRYVFISHARTDAALVAQIITALPIEAWEDPDHYEGKRAEAILETAITNCSVFVVVLTRISIQRPWVRWEVDKAMALPELPIIPVYSGLNPATLPEPFDALQQFTPTSLSDSVAVIENVVNRYAVPSPS